MKTKSVSVLTLILLGPIIGRAADRWGRRWLVPAGIAIAALAKDTVHIVAIRI
jgi:MFS family permease